MNTKETFGNNPRNWEGDFNAWMKGVNNLLANRLAGLTSEDIEDRDYWNMWNDGMTPSQGFNQIIEEISNEGWDV